MTICLMAYVPNKLIGWSIKYIMKRYCQFYHTQTGAKMATINRDIIDDKVAQLITQLNQLRLIKFFQIIRAVYLR